MSAKTLAIVACLLLSLNAWCQQDTIVRPVQSTYSLECGTAHMADTYLSPLHYDGYRAAISYQRAQALGFKPTRWLMQLDLGLDFESTENPARNATMAAIGLSASYRMLCKWKLPKNISVGVGPAASLHVGALYLSRNGNNPASAKAAFTFDAAAFASWNVRIKRLPITVRYQATLPVIGAFFSPNYGQLYYQIYMGDTQRLAHVAWWGSYFGLENLLTADLHLGSHSLRLGYRCNILSTEACHIVSRDISHSFVIGISTDWISLNRGKLPTSTNIANAY